MDQCGYTDRGVAVHDHESAACLKDPPHARSDKWVNGPTSFTSRPYDPNKDGEISEWFEEGADVSAVTRVKTGLRAVHDHKGRSSNGAVEYRTEPNPNYSGHGTS